MPAAHSFSIYNLNTACVIHHVGMSWLFNDRQFICRGVAVHFPDGTRALAVYTPSAPQTADAAISRSRTVRAHMGVSGYVVSPYAGEERRYLGDNKCQITMVLQVDPRVGTTPSQGLRVAVLLVAACWDALHIKWSNSSCNVGSSRMVVPATAVQLGPACGLVFLLEMSGKPYMGALTKALSIGTTAACTADAAVTCAGWCPSACIQHREHADAHEPAASEGSSSKAQARGEGSDDSETDGDLGSIKTRGSKSNKVRRQVALRPSWGFHGGL